MVKNGYKKYKTGFSLLEAMVVMVIVAIFVAVIANSIPHKSKPKLSAEIHGGYECYWKNNQLYSRSIAISTETAEKEESGNCCNFRPNQYVNFIVFNVVGGGSVGGSDTGGGAGAFMSAFFSSPNNNYQLCPGKGGSATSSDGEQSYVTSDGKTIVTADGGNEATTIRNTKYSDILSVYVDKAMDSNVPVYGCSYTPRAWLDDTDQTIHISFCRTSLDITEKTLEYSNTEYETNKDKYKTVLQSPLLNTPLLNITQQDENTVLEYYDVGEFVDYGKDPRTHESCKADNYAKITSMSDPMCPSRYKLNIKLNQLSNDAGGETSGLTKYAELMNYTNLAEIEPGNGGAQGGQEGKPGAVLVV